MGEDRRTKRTVPLLKRWIWRRDVLALIGLIGVSFALRLWGGVGRPTINMVPDEYVYSEISRSLASSFEPLIRGHFAHYFSLAFPLFSAPLWTFGDVESAYRLKIGRAHV